MVLVESTKPDMACLAVARCHLPLKYVWYSIWKEHCCQLASTRVRHWSSTRKFLTSRSGAGNMKVLRHLAGPLLKTAAKYVPSYCTVVVRSLVLGYANAAVLECTAQACVNVKVDVLIMKTKLSCMNYVCSFFIHDSWCYCNLSVISSVPWYSMPRLLANCQSEIWLQSGFTFLYKSTTQFQKSPLEKIACL